MPGVRPVAGAEPCPQWQFGDAWRTCPPVPCPLQSGLALPSRSTPHVQVIPGKHPPVPLAYGAFGKRGEETRHRIKSRGLMFYLCVPFPCICLGLPPWDPAKGTKPQCLWDPAPRLSPLDNLSAELHLAGSPTLVTLLQGLGSRWARSPWSPGTRLERSVSSNQAVGTTGAHSLASPSHFIKGSHGIMRAEVEDGLSLLGPVARGAPVCRRGRGRSPRPASVPGPVL